LPAIGTPFGKLIPELVQDRRLTDLLIWPL